MPSDNIESRIEEVKAENRYGKRARMVSKDDIVLDSNYFLNTNIQQENIQQNNSPKSHYSNKEDGREEIDKVLDTIYALFVTIKSKEDMEAISTISQVHQSTTKQKEEEICYVFHVIYATLTEKQMVKLKNLNKCYVGGNQHIDFT